MTAFPPTSLGDNSLAGELLERLAPLLERLCALRPEHYERQFAEILRRLESLETAATVASREPPIVCQPVENFPGDGAPPAAGEASTIEALDRSLFDGLDHEPALRLGRRELIDALLRRDVAAGALVGALLLFRSAPVGDKPRLLKTVGEAWHRWRRQAIESQPLEDALLRWLNATCREMAIPLTVERVEPGVRYDPERHAADGRSGRDVTDVFGWVVVRDNNTVFEKAKVAVR